VVKETLREQIRKEVGEGLRAGGSAFLFRSIRERAAGWDYEIFRETCQEMFQAALLSDSAKPQVIEILTLLLDRRWDPGEKRRSCLGEILLESLEEVFSSFPGLQSGRAGAYRRLDWATRDALRQCGPGEQTLVVEASGFPPEGEEGPARVLTRAYSLGWRKFIVYGCRGQRFVGCGFGPGTKGARIDVYGSSGDYLASGMDGLEIVVHGNAQDQLGQILASGKLVIHGDVGQTFLYGAKGGTVFVLGNAAGRPLINAVGKPKVVINGTCLDYLAESFMAGDPHNGGGFIVLNGMEFDEHGLLREQPSPFPGSNLFSLASGGALYVRDPGRSLQREQLNGGEFAPFTEKDWRLILPLLKENEELFGISVEGDLLTCGGERRRPEEVYRKIRAVKLSVLSAGLEKEED
jgi:glutamate synthase domain-containing protein 3